MKQTAVEWLENELIQFNFNDTQKLVLSILLYQAKEMEKQQICDSHNNGFSEGAVFVVNTNYKYKTAKQYYNENYEK
jgi:hypothetical protein